MVTWGGGASAVRVESGVPGEGDAGGTATRAAPRSRIAASTSRVTNNPSRIRREEGLGGSGVCDMGEHLMWDNLAGRLATQCDLQPHHQCIGDPGQASQ